MDAIKELLGEELFDQVKEKLNGQKLILNDGKSYVPKSRLDEEIDKVKNLRKLKDEHSKEMAEKVELTTKLETDIETLKKDSGNVEELNQKIETLTAENKEVTDKANVDKLGFKKSSKVREKLLAAKADPGYLEYLEGKMTVELSEDGKTLTGIDEELEKAQKNYSKMFGETKSVGTDPIIPDGNKAGEFFTMDEIRAMDQATTNDNMKKVNESLEYWGKQ